MFLHQSSRGSNDELWFFTMQRLFKSTCLYDWIPAVWLNFSQGQFRIKIVTIKRDEKSFWRPQEVSLFAVKRKFWIQSDYIKSFSHSFNEKQILMYLSENKWSPIFTPKYTFIIKLNINLLKHLNDTKLMLAWAWWDQTFKNS